MSLDPSHGQPQYPCAHLQVGQFGGIADEIDGLKRDKNVLMVELVRLRQQQAQADHTVRQLQVRQF